MIKIYILFAGVMVLLGVTYADDFLVKEDNDKGIKFYDKAILSDPIMQFDRDVLRRQMDQHIFYVREGSRGGYDSSGGACGCN